MFDIAKSSIQPLEIRDPVDKAVYVGGQLGRNGTSW
jgi:hypothetical protein